MKIQKILPQFEKDKVFIVVSGRQSSLIYTAHKGKIEKINEYKYITPKYSDKEGFGIRSKGGQVYSSGWVLEKNKHDIIDHFVKKFRAVLSKELKINKPKKLYFFIPLHYKDEIFNKLPKSITSIIEGIYYGNYTKKEPFYLLDIIRKDEIKKVKSKIVIPIKKESLKILKKSNKARRVIKGRPDN